MIDDERIARLRVRVEPFGHEDVRAQEHRPSPELREALALDPLVADVLRGRRIGNGRDRLVERDLHRAGGRGIDRDLARRAVQVAGRAVPLLALAAVHGQLDRVAVAAAERLVPVQQRLHRVRARGQLAQRLQRIAEDAGLEGRGARPGAQPSTSMPKACWLLGPSSIWKRGSWLSSLETSRSRRPSRGPAARPGATRTTKRGPAGGADRTARGEASRGRASRGQAIGERRRRGMSPPGKVDEEPAESSTRVPSIECPRHPGSAALRGIDCRRSRNTGDGGHGHDDRDPLPARGGGACSGRPARRPRSTPVPDRRPLRPPRLRPPAARPGRAAGPGRHHPHLRRRRAVRLHARLAAARLRRTQRAHLGPVPVPAAAHELDALARRRRRRSPSPASS